MTTELDMLERYVTYLRRPNVFSGSFNAARLHSARLIEALIPSLLDHMLYLPNNRNPIRGSFKNLRPCGNDVAEKHLNVVITTEIVAFISALDFYLPNVTDSGVAKVCRLNVAVLLKQLAQDTGDSGWRFF